MGVKDTPGGDIHIIDCEFKKQKRVTIFTYGAGLHGLADLMEAKRVIVCAYTELYRGANTFDELCRIENTGSYYYYPIEACLYAKSVYESIVHADPKTPKRSLSSIYSVG